MWVVVGGQSQSERASARLVVGHAPARRVPAAGFFLVYNDSSAALY